MEAAIRRMNEEAKTKTKEWDEGFSKYIKNTDDLNAEFQKRADDLNKGYKKEMKKIEESFKPLNDIINDMKATTSNGVIGNATSMPGPNYAGDIGWNYEPSTTPFIPLEPQPLSVPFNYKHIYYPEDTFVKLKPDETIVLEKKKEAPLGIKISIDGTLYSLEEAEKLYLELDKIFANSKQLKEVTLEERDYMPIWRVPTYEEAGRVRGWRGVVSTTTAVGGDTKEVTTDTDKAMPIDGGIRISYHSDKASPRRKTSTGCYPPRRGKHRQ